jgi:hypothetical protein
MDKKLYNKILDVFVHAEGVDDTIWYNEHETLFEAVIRVIDEHNRDRDMEGR